MPDVRRTLFILMVATCASLARADAATPEPKRVLLVQSFGRAAPITTLSLSFESELVSKIGEPVDLEEVSVDMARYAEPELQEAVAEYLEKHQAKWKPDLVVPIAGPAAIFVAKYRERLFPDTPILYLGSDPRFLATDALQKNATFVGHRAVEIPALVEDMLQVAPATKNIVVVVGATPFERVWKEVIEKAAAPYADRIKFTYYSDLSFEQMEERAAHLPPDSFILFLILLRDAAGVTGNTDEMLRRLAPVANAPVYSMFAHQLGTGVVGGRLYPTELMGKEAGDVAGRILHGEPASNFPPKIIEKLPPRYDARALKRWNISEKLLPPGSTILFREPTVWERYRAWIIGGVSIVLLQSLLIMGLLFNLIRRRRAEQSLQQSEQRIALATEAARIGVWELNPATKEFWASEKWRELFGFEPDEQVSYEDLRSRIHPDDRAKHDRALAHAMESHEQIEKEFRILLPDGTLRWIAGRALSLRNPTGAVDRLFGVAVDVTGRKQAQVEARQQREQLNRLSRVSLLGEMTASIAHELNQPLTAIISNANAGRRVIDSGRSEADLLREILVSVAADGHRAHEIIQNVRNTLKKGNAIRQRIDLNELVQGVVLVVRSDAITSSSEVQTSLASDLPAIHGDPVQLQQVLVNLVSNALDAMRQTPVSQRKVEISTAWNGDGEVHLSVRDHGCGISAGDRERLFDQFFTTKEQGLGMGLAIVRSIVEAHGGQIQAENMSDSGARFSFGLPVSQNAGA